MKTKESPEVWTPPEVIILVRSEPEEAVLTACKGNYSYPKASDGNYDNCRDYETACIEICNSTVTS
jgi:hypothetical protein